MVFAICVLYSFQDTMSLAEIVFLLFLCGVHFAPTTNRSHIHTNHVEHFCMSNCLIAWKDLAFSMVQVIAVCCYCNCSLLVFLVIFTLVHSLTYQWQNQNNQISIRTAEEKHEYWSGMGVKVWNSSNISTYKISELIFKVYQLFDLSFCCVYVINSTSLKTFPKNVRLAIQIPVDSILI